VGQELELQIISLFVEKHKRRRLRGLISSGKRDQAIAQLNDPSVFDKRYRYEYGGSKRQVEILADQYKKYGMGNRVYVVSGNPEWDARHFELQSILNECLMSPYCQRQHKSDPLWS